MPRVSPDAQLLVIGVSSPMLAGVYVDGKLRERYEADGKTSEALPPILHDVRYRYRLTSLFYAKGPGSFMAVKVAYVMLKTFAIALDIPLRAVDAFAFNRGTPIKAVGRSFFVKKEDRIDIQRHIDTSPLPFELPASLDEISFSSDTEPMYILPAV